MADTKKINGIEMISVSSKTVTSIGYNPENKIMLAEFNTGSVYEYKDVSSDEYQSIKEDVSVGSKLRKIVSLKEYKKL